MNDRKILQLSPQVKPDDPRAEADFSSLSEVPNIVLLGDPSAGKTHLFRSAAQATGGHYMTVRSFLNARSDWSAATVFIDALDERRAGRGDDEVVDAIVRRLFACAPARVRISCRAQDWLADSDLEAFRQYFDDHGGVIVVSLFPLSDQEQRAVLAEHGMDVSAIDGFLAEVDEHGLAEFKRNPQDLKMLATAVTNGVWPATRADLFEQSTRRELIVGTLAPRLPARFSQSFSTCAFRRSARALESSWRLRWRTPQSTRGIVGTAPDRTKEDIVAVDPPSA